MQELKPFDWQEVEGVEPLYMARLKIEEGMRQLKAMREILDLELIDRMKKENVKSFQFGESKICYGSKKSEKITDTRKLKKMLVNFNEDIRTLAIAALSDSGSAWKIAKVREIQDTLGIPLLDISYSDEIEVKVINEKFLK